MSKDWPFQQIQRLFSKTTSIDKKGSTIYKIYLLIRIIIDMGNLIKHIRIRITEDQFRELSDFLKGQQMNRSDLIRKLLRDYLMVHYYTRVEQDRSKKWEKRLFISSEKDQKKFDLARDFEIEEFVVTDFNDTRPGFRPVSSEQCYISSLYWSWNIWIYAAMQKKALNLYCRK